MSLENSEPTVIFKKTVCDDESFVTLHLLAEHSRQKKAMLWIAATFIQAERH